MDKNDKVIYPNFKPKTPPSPISNAVIIQDSSLTPKRHTWWWDKGWEITSESKIDLIDVDD